MGYVLTKNLIEVDPRAGLTIDLMRTAKTRTRKGGREGGRVLRCPIVVSPSCPLIHILSTFQLGRAHIALVSEAPEETLACLLGEHGAEGGLEGGRGGAVPVGIVTLEDVMEMMLQAEIWDETDVREEGEEEEEEEEEAEEEEGKKEEKEKREAKEEMEEEGETQKEGLEQLLRLLKEGGKGEVVIEEGGREEDVGKGRRRLRKALPLSSVVGGKGERGGEREGGRAPMVAAGSPTPIASTAASSHSIASSGGLSSSNRSSSNSSGGDSSSIDDNSSAIVSAALRRRFPCFFSSPFASSISSIRALAAANASAAAVSTATATSCDTTTAPSTIAAAPAAPAATAATTAAVTSSPSSCFSGPSEASSSCTSGDVRRHIPSLAPSPSSPLSLLSSLPSPSRSFDKKKNVSHWARLRQAVNQTRLARLKNSVLDDSTHGRGTRKGGKEYGRLEEWAGGVSECEAFTFMEGEEGEEEGKDGGKEALGKRVIEMEMLTVLERSLHGGMNGGRDGGKDGGLGQVSIAIPPGMTDAGMRGGKEGGKEERTM